MNSEGQGLCYLPKSSVLVDITNKLDITVVWGSETNIYVMQFTCSHGNKRAGVIAGKRGNDLCGTGLAYEASIAGKSITLVD